MTLEYITRLLLAEPPEQDIAPRTQAEMQRVRLIGLGWASGQLLAGAAGLPATPERAALLGAAMTLAQAGR